MPKANGKQRADAIFTEFESSGRNSSYDRTSWKPNVIRTQKHREYTRTPHRTLAATSSVSWMLKPLPNILAITGGVSTRQKEGKGKTELRTCRNHGTPTHDRDTNAMLMSVRTCYFLPRIHVRKNSGAQWRTFYHFASYKGAHTQGLQDIKGGNSLRKVDSDATHDFRYARFLTFIMLTLMALTHMEIHTKPNQMA